MIHIYVTEITSRVEYTFKLFFETILNDVVLLHTSIDAFSEVQGVKINYSDNLKVTGLYFKPVSLLFENHLQQQNPTIIDWQGETGFFEVEGSTCPFDVFAASFYLVSRYEEYLPGKIDQHQRYMSSDSIAAKNCFLEKPVINRWALKLADLIETAFPQHRFKRSKFNYTPTIDIDNAYAFKYKGFMRTVFSVGNDLMNGRWSLLSKRFAVLVGNEKDPYDNYDFLWQLFERNRFQPVYFILLNNSGKRDRSLSPKRQAFQLLISKLAQKGEIGIHPSYQSNRLVGQLNREILSLKAITGNKVTRSRQHYLKLLFPQTYRNLISARIEADYTMGYPDRSGFRAGIATPFPFFDIIENKATALIVYPFQVMDVTLAQYGKMDTSEALSIIKTLMIETAAVGGTFISLWHNESLSDEEQWKGWRNVYSEMTRMAYNLTNDRKN